MNAEINGMTLKQENNLNLPKRFHPNLKRPEKNSCVKIHLKCVFAGQTEIYLQTMSHSHAVMQRLKRRTKTCFLKRGLNVWNIVFFAIRFTLLI